MAANLPKHNHFFYKDVMSIDQIDTGDTWIMSTNGNISSVVLSIKCTGTCSTGCTQGGTPYYFGLHQRDMEQSNDGKPKFRIFFCPGVNERKAQIKEQYLNEPETDEREPSKIKARDLQRKFLS